MICKPPRGYSSVGITEVSRCADAQALRAQASRLLGAGGGALIEEFIDGAQPDDDTILSASACVINNISHTQAGR